MVEYRYNAARGNVSRLCASTGLVEAEYTGPITLPAFNALRESMMQTTNGAPCSVVRLDRALLLAHEFPPVEEKNVVVPPAILIVRREQYDAFADYSRKLAAQGITRLVYLDEFAPLAYQIALQLCAAGRGQ